MCSRVEGQHVLDVGCSQGIASILLAREGKTVTGIDAQVAAIDFAAARLVEEDEPVRSRVDFMVAEAQELPFEEASFDSLLMGELLEHLVDPIPPLVEARRVIRPGGRLVLTSPYGISRSADHKEPLYLRRLFDWLDGSFEVSEIVLFEGAVSVYVGLVATPRIENAASSREASLMQALTLGETRLARTERELERRTEQVAELKAELVELRATGRQERLEQAKKVEALHARDASAKQLREQAAGLKAKLQEEVGRRRALEQQIWEMRADSRALARELESAKARRRRRG
jgi:2-polyprenyl-6-hydroxyphenyl methylase/3-demethylubiquinone-9 3-methyltransferase